MIHGPSPITTALAARPAAKLPLGPTAAKLANPRTGPRIAAALAGKPTFTIAIEPASFPAKPKTRALAHTAPDEAQNLVRGRSLAHRRPWSVDRASLAAASQTPALAHRWPPTEVPH